MKRIALISSLIVGCAHPPAPPPPDSPKPAASVASAPVPSASASAVLAEPTPREPPYDLAGDLESRKQAIRKQVGTKTKFEVVDRVFLIAAPNGAMGASAVVSKKALEAYFHGRFTKKPERAVTILLFENAPPYHAFCKATWGDECFTPFGFYTHEIRTVVMNVGPGIGTLTHELVHPLVEADFPKAPDWINEGIASLYEAFSLPKAGEIRGNKNFRHPALLEALRSKKDRTWASLPNLFSMTDKIFRGKREGLNYAIARYFCQWMDGQNKLWPFYHAWRDDFAKDPTGEKAFLAVMGKSPADLDAAWAAWVKAL
ncbi:MAG: hypothetical protein ACXVEF_00530 [Polyangiales bacterium]